MNFHELLPIGSVVLLTGAKKKLMIFGVGQSNLTNGITYDYIGVLYPEGSMGEDSQVLFNHEDIQEVCFRGYEDDERAGFLDRLQKYYEENA